MFKDIPRVHYLLVLLNAVFVSLFITQATVFLGKPAVYLILLILVSLNVWFAGRRIALITVGIAAINFLLFYLYPQRMSVIKFAASLYELALFIIAGVLQIVFIEKYKKTDLVRLHLQKEAALKEQVQNLQKNVSKMQKEVKMRDEFLSIASHELKTPLTSMLLKIQMILHNIRNVSLANFSVNNLMRQLETAEGQTKRLSQMINDLLNVSLITTGKMNLQKRKEDILEIVKEVLNEFDEKLKSESITLNLKAKKPAQANVDKVRIAQVLSNLITNAIKYGKGKPIDMEIISSSSKVFISIKDQGIGIPNDQKEIIFSLFERGANGKEMQGLGVGLYIANQIIKAHNGKIKVKSNPGNGSEFIVELPLN